MHVDIIICAVANRTLNTTGNCAKLCFILAKFERQLRNAAMSLASRRGIGTTIQQNNDNTVCIAVKMLHGRVLGQLMLVQKSWTRSCFVQVGATSVSCSYKFRHWISQQQHRSLCYKCCKMIFKADFWSCNNLKPIARLCNFLLSLPSQSGQAYVTTAAMQTSTPQRCTTLF